MDKAQFTGLVKATSSDKQHPLQSVVEFVFTDFKPNKNKQGVKAAEASNIMNTGLYMPVKADFSGITIGDHKNAIPVGPIIEMAQREDTVIGKAVIWKDEFPDLTNYLEKASASEGGVQFSWEIYYKDQEIDDSGTQWLKDCVVAGIAIVGNPAYAGRTPLLSFAADQEKIQALESEVTTLTEQLSATKKREDEMELEAVVAQLTALQTSVDGLAEKLVALQPVVQEPAVAEVDPDVEALKSELEQLREFKADAERKQAQAELMNTRTQALSGLLTAEEITDRAEFILGLSDDQFTTYAASLQAVVAKSSTKKADASARVTIPDPLLSSGGLNQITIKDIAQGLIKMREGA